MEIYRQIRHAISSAIEGVHVEVLDPRNDGTHLEAIVVSDTFTDLSLIKRQRQVMDVLKPLFDTSLHALSLQTWTHAEWEKKKSCKT